MGASSSSNRNINAIVKKTYQRQDDVRGGAGGGNQTSKGQQMTQVYDCPLEFGYNQKEIKHILAAVLHTFAQTRRQ